MVLSVRACLLGLACIVGGTSGFFRAPLGARHVVGSPVPRCRMRPLAAVSPTRRELLSGAVLALGIPALPQDAFGANGDADEEAAKKQADEARKAALVSARHQPPQPPTTQPPQPPTTHSRSRSHATPYLKAKKIEDSKKNFRKADSLYDARKTVDYSCVSSTGSPCPPECATGRSMSACVGVGGGGGGGGGGAASGQLEDL